LSDNVAKYLTRAEEAKEHANRTLSPVDQQMWLKLAAEWTKLAEIAEAEAKK
jgi:hypothetical protein